MIHSKVDVFQKGNRWDDRVIFDCDAGRPAPGELPKTTRDLEAERRRDEESGPPKNRAILEKPHRAYSHSPDKKQ